MASIRRRLDSLVETGALRQFVRELLHTGVAWLVFVVVVVWMVMCQEWSDMRWLRSQSRGPGHPPQHDPQGPHGPHSRSPYSPNIPTGRALEDMVLSRLPYKSIQDGWISDLLVNSAGLICVVGCFLMARGWRARLVMLRRVAWIVGVLYLMRSVTISVTTIPPPFADCHPVVAQNASEMARAVLGMISGQTKECTDMVFSGHTVILLVSFLFWTRYARHWVFVAYSAVHTLLGVASVPLVRYHYTLDVCLALVLTYFVHHVYYRSLETATRLQTARVSEHRCVRRVRLDAAVRARSFVYTRVDDVENNAELCVDNAGAADALFAAHRCSLSNVDCEQAAEKASLTLTANSPEQAARRTTEDRGSSGDIEKALESVVAAGSSSSACNCCLLDMPYGSYDGEAFDTMLLVNRPTSNYLATAVAWMDGLHLRQDKSS
ncbi:hypothetical protein GGI07_005432 [Coemansia sp. Benny D115]|nr:hypothetical protein GGI07_005432 [Coemansia sp. Benny D115]